MDDPHLRPAEAALLERVAFQIKRSIVGQDRAIERILVCLLADGHCLIEGVPGLAKTRMVHALAAAVGGTFVRIQFTPDLVPSDLVGTRIWRASTETFDVELGPVVANFVLADEINRAPAKVQSALLEVMEERQVSIGGHTHPMPRPFLVLATQNPIEHEGVYPLPEAQRDRFLMKVLVGYPHHHEELEIVQRIGGRPVVADRILEPGDVVRLQQEARRVYVDTAVADYAVRLVLATRDPASVGLAELAPYVAFGASPRASIGLVAAGRALALLRGRAYVVPQDVFDVAPEVLRHRLVLTYEAVADGVGPDDVLSRIVGTVVAPATGTDRARIGDRLGTTAAAVVPVARTPGGGPAGSPPGGVDGTGGDDGGTTGAAADALWTAELEDEPAEPDGGPR